MDYKIVLKVFYRVLPEAKTVEILRCWDGRRGSSGCRPVPLPHKVDGNALVLAENDVLVGWRYFR